MVKRVAVFFNKDMGLKVEINPSDFQIKSILKNNEKAMVYDIQHKTKIKLNGNKLYADPKDYWPEIEEIVAKAVKEMQ